MTKLGVTSLWRCCINMEQRVPDSEIPYLKHRAAAFIAPIRRHTQRDLEATSCFLFQHQHPAG